jgi:hypothetical protein
MTCWVARFGMYERGHMPPCDGQVIRAHLIPRRLLLRELDAATAAKAIDDPRSWVPCCGGPTGAGGHHGMLDVSRTIRIPYRCLPVGLHSLCEELGLTWWLDREYGEFAHD